MIHYLFICFFFFIPCIHGNSWMRYFFFISMTIKHLYSTSSVAVWFIILFPNKHFENPSDIVDDMNTVVINPVVFGTICEITWISFRHYQWLLVVVEEDFAITDNFELGSRKNVEPSFGGEYWYTGVSFRNISKRKLFFLKNATLCVQQPGTPEPHPTNYSRTELSYHLQPKLLP